MFEAGPQPRRRAEGEPGEVAARLLQRSDGADERRRADLLHDQGDHEPARAVAARRQLLGHRHRALRRLLALSRGDPPDRSAGARAVAARAVAAGRTATRRRCWSCRSSGATATCVGNGFANHRSGDESCRRVWLVALGAGVPKGAGTERPIRTTDVAPTVARILGFKMPECEGQPLARAGVLSVAETAMQFDARLDRRSRDAGAGARGSCSTRLPATFHARSSSSSEVGDAVRGRAGVSARAARSISPRCRGADAARCFAGHRAVESRGRLRSDWRARDPGTLPGRGAGAAAQAAAAAGVAPGGRRASSSRSQPALDRAAPSAGCAAPAGGPDLRQRHLRSRPTSCGAASAGTGVRVPLTLDGARGAEGFCAALFGGAPTPARDARCAAAAARAAPRRSTPGSSSRARRCTPAARRPARDRVGARTPV